MSAQYEADLDARALLLAGELALADWFSDSGWCRDRVAEGLADELGPWSIECPWEVEEIEARCEVARDMAWRVWDAYGDALANVVRYRTM